MRLPHITPAIATPAATVAVGAALFLGAVNRGPDRTPVPIPADTRPFVLPTAPTAPRTGNHLAPDGTIHLIHPARTDPATAVTGTP